MCLPNEVKFEIVVLNVVFETLITLNDLKFIKIKANLIEFNKEFIKLNPTSSSSWVNNSRFTILIRFFVRL
jgi:hypothetical protein